MDPMSAINAARMLVRFIGDANAWNLEVRMWCYERAGSLLIGSLKKAEESRREHAETLETWVTDVAGGFGRQRREGLKMRCFDLVPVQAETERRTQATDLYLWAVAAESLRPEEPEAPKGEVDDRGFVPREPSR